MSDTSAVPHRNTPSRPPGSEALDGRSSARASSRNSARADYTPPEPHEKFHLFDEEIPDGMDAMWLPITVAGQPNGKVNELFRAGWEVARAEQVPRLSGFGHEYPEAMVRAGLLKNTEADEPVIVDTQMLVFRPLELSRRAKAVEQRHSAEQVDNQMRRLRMTSRKFSQTETTRGRYAPMPDSAQFDE